VFTQIIEEESILPPFELQFEVMVVIAFLCTKEINLSCTFRRYYLPRTTTENSATTEQKTDEVMVVDEINVEVKMWDDHIERLEAKLSFLIGSYDDPNLDLLYQYEKKVATLKREINDAIEQRHMLIGRDTNYYLVNR